MDQHTETGARRRPAPQDITRVEDAFVRLCELEGLALELAREDEAHRQALGEVEARILDCHGRIKDARIALAALIIEADGRPVPTIDRWFHSISPAWQVRNEYQAFALIPTTDDGPPDDLDDAASKVTLAVVDLGGLLDEEEADPR